jgi:hypothetical protein
MHFHVRLVGRDGPIPRPPRLPHISSLNIILWEYLKDTVYKTLVTSFVEPKLQIVAIETIASSQMLENTWRETEYRLDTLRAVKGATLKLFSTLQY